MSDDTFDHNTYSPGIMVTSTSTVSQMKSGSGTPDYVYARNRR
jgi:hypothetical protein